MDGLTGLCFFDSSEIQVDLQKEGKSKEAMSLNVCHNLPLSSALLSCKFLVHFEIDVQASWPDWP